MRTYLPVIVISCAVVFPLSAQDDSLRWDDGVLMAQMSNQMMNSQDTRSFQDTRGQDMRQSAGRGLEPSTQGMSRPDARFSSSQSLGQASDQQDARMQDSSRQPVGQTRR